MSVVIYSLVQFRRMAAVLATSAPQQRGDPLTRDALIQKAPNQEGPSEQTLAEVFAAASAANHRAFLATYGERAEGYLARMGDARPFDAAMLIAAFAEPVAASEPGLARTDAELLIYNTIDNEGVEHLSARENLAVARVVGLVVLACDRLARTGQTEPLRLRLIEGGQI